MRNFTRKSPRKFFPVGATRHQLRDWTFVFVSYCGRRVRAFLLKPWRKNVETLDTMVRITMMDGQVDEVARETVQGILPWRPIFKNPHLKSDGLTYHAGNLLPVNGPLPEAGAESLGLHERPWLLCLGTHAQVVRGFPAFDDEIFLNLVPAREIAAPVIAAVAEEETSAAEAVMAQAPALTLLDMTAMLSEEDEESQLLRELEDLVKAA